MHSNFVLSEFKHQRPRSQSVIFPRLGPSLHAMPTAAGFDRCRDPRYDWHGLKRGKERFCLFQYTLGGSGSLEFHGRHYDVAVGTAMILTIPDNHRYRLEKNGRWDFFYLCLNGADVIDAWQTVIREAGPLITLDTRSTILRSAVRLCRRILDGNLRSAWHASGLAYDLAMKMLEGFTGRVPVRANHERPAGVQKAMEFCLQNLGSPIGVADLAAAAGYSRYHFSRIFHASEGIGPGEFICRQRLMRAVELMKQPGESVKAVAHKCGFQSSGYFCRVFRQMYGISPGAFRNSGMY